ncbi:Rhs element Vgr protein [Paraburkholderia sp. BL6665CI2N2]|uniref:type VI secretion system Vgr family protein n=1 Tax=Paraburkholderia sp. BL6665CI2N2 TaxID=1938806 RepID=UPI0010F3AE56|nr:type VI secretion system Vgr family protein [Paraburkholderia sp. BL6665CI2N2]TDY22476.1 Rhs element Vgr protein [Paraburkholderia sp. BL6665CI2N2]
MLDFSTRRTITVSGAALPESPSGEPALVLRSIRGEEALSEIYTYTLDMVTPQDLDMFGDDAANLDLRAMIGRPLTVAIQLEGMSGVAGPSWMSNIGCGMREISGIVTSARFVEQQDRQSHYRLTLQPGLSLAGQRSDYRIFQRKNVIDIIREVLRIYPFSCAWRTSRIYPRLDYQVQYGETDLNFVQRLMAENGIYWFFEHSKGYHRMVFVDHVGAHKPVQSEAYHTLAYYPPGHRIDAEYIDAFDIAQTLQSGVWTTGDYDFKQPEANLGVRKVQPQKTIHNDLARYEWPGDYTDPAEGEKSAQIRIEELFARGERAEGRGALRNVVCGTTFHLENHPYRNANQEYMVIRAKLDAEETMESTGPGVYRFDTDFTVQPATNVFRPARTVPKPRTTGPQSAVVTGFDRNVVSTEPYGRVTLKFRWDRSPNRDENSSCWARVMSPWAGNGHGAISLPRIGTEVIVDFIDGDPDRPFVIGQAYNADNMPPWPLQDNHALSGLLSRNLEGSGSNQFVADDTPDRLQAQVTSDQANSRLVVGYNTRIVPGEGRKQARGIGWELATDSWGVVRANRGMLVTTETRSGAQSPAKDMGETVQRLTQARAQHEDMARLAQQHNAQSSDASQHDTAKAIKAQNDAIRGDTAHWRENPFPEMTRPDLVVASAAGIGMTAAQGTHIVSGQDHAVTAGRDVSVSSGRSLFASVRGAISMFAYQLGLKLIAAKGRVDIQAQSDQIALAALKDITVSSTDGKVVITASKEVWIGAGGSYIQINGSGIINGSPGVILEKGANWDVPGPSLMYPRLPQLATHPIVFSCAAFSSLEAGAASPAMVSAAPTTSTPAASLPTEESLAVALGTVPHSDFAPLAPTEASRRKDELCTWRMDDVVENVRRNVDSANYLAVNADGTPLMSGETQYMANYESFCGFFELAYDSKRNAITATVRVLTKPKQIRESKPDGTSTLVPYNHDKDQFPTRFPNRKMEDRMVESISQYLIDTKAKVEKDLNQNGYQLTIADCVKGGACSCRIPVTFKVDLMTTDPKNLAHTSVNIHVKSERADSANWSELVTGTIQGRQYEVKTHHVETHEVGHLFSFPDEYYWAGGAVHKQYIKSDKTVDVPLAKNNPNKQTWQGSTTGTLMGQGVYLPVSQTPSYYLEHICEWFRNKNGVTWKAVETNKA